MILDSLVQVGATAILSIGGSWAIVYFVARRGIKYVDSYLDTKAKNLATHEDIMKLVDQVRETEKVKAEITDNVWDRQQRWTFKQGVYRELVESLTELHLGRIKEHVTSRWKSPLTKDGDETVKQIRERIIECVGRLEIMMRVSALVANDETFHLITKLSGNGFQGTTKEELDLLQRALIEITLSARRDLGYPDFNPLPGPSEAATKV